MNVQYKVNVKRLKSFLSEVGLGFGSVYSCVICAFVAFLLH